MTEDEPEQPELEAQMEVATEAIRAAVLELVLAVHSVRSAREFLIEPTPAHSDSIRPAGCAWNGLLAGPASTWEEAAEKARYLIMLLADMPEERDPRRQKIIAGVLDDFARLAGRPTGPAVPNEPDPSNE